MHVHRIVVKLRMMRRPPRDESGWWRQQEAGVVKAPGAAAAARSSVVGGAGPLPSRRAERLLLEERLRHWTDKYRPALLPTLAHLLLMRMLLTLLLRRRGWTRAEPIRGPLPRRLLPLTFRFTFALFPGWHGGDHRTMGGA